LIVIPPFIDNGTPAGTLDGTCATRVKSAVAPKTYCASEHETVPVAPTAGVVQLQPRGEASETKVVLPSRLSVTVALLESLGPLLIVLMVYVTSVPAETGSGDDEPVIATSA
jgi:hypothetical protein